MQQCCARACALVTFVTPNMSQPCGSNTRNTMLRSFGRACKYWANNVAICCIEMLQLALEGWAIWESKNGSYLLCSSFLPFVSFTVTTGDIKHQKIELSKRLHCYASKQMKDRNLNCSGRCKVMNNHPCHILKIQSNLRLQQKRKENSGLNFTITQVVYVTATINHTFILFFAVQIYGLSYIHCIFTIFRYITNSQSGQPPVGLIAQLVGHCTSIAEVLG